MNIQLTNNKKEHIYQSTLKLIFEGGFHGSPMSKIAKEAGIAVGSIYHYFPSKEDLIVEIYWYCKEMLNIHVFHEKDNNLPFEVRFKNIWMNLVKFYRKNVEIFSFLEQFYGSPFYQEARISVSAYKAEKNKLVDFLEEGKHLNQLKNLNTRILISTYIGPATTLVRSCLFTNSSLDMLELDELITIIWNGVKL